MFCLRNGVGDEERKEEEGVIFEFLFCASGLAGRGRLVRNGEYVSFVAPASSSIYHLYNYFTVLISAPLFCAWSCGSPRGCDPNQVSHPTYCTSDDVYGWCCVHPFIAREWPDKSQFSHTLHCYPWRCIVLERR